MVASLRMLFRRGLVTGALALLTVAALPSESDAQTMPNQNRQRTMRSQRQTGGHTGQNRGTPGRAPELDTRVTGSALALLVGGMLLLGERRRRSLA
jgi:hypothetical protein